jgi:excisionase family DNA binding protein
MPQVDAMTPLAYSILDSAKQLSVSPQSVRKLIERGELRTRRVGVRVLVPRAELERFLSAEGK